MAVESRPDDHINHGVEAAMDTTGSDSGRESTGDIRKTVDDASSTCKVVVIGGCCLLGRHVARTLYQELDNVEIALFDRTKATSEIFQFITRGRQNGHRVHYNPVHTDILNKEHLRNVLCRATVVVHCADMREGRGWFQRRKMQQFNVEGTRNVVEVSKECGVRALVYCGSVDQDAESRDYDGPTVSDLSSVYTRSKARAERLVLEANNSVNNEGATLYTCSLRLPSLYGCYDTCFIPRAVQAARKLRGYHFVPSASFCPGAYVGNGSWAVACAVQKLLGQGSRSYIGGHFYNINDNTPTAGAEFYRHFLSPFDCKVVTIHPLLMLVLKLILGLVTVVVLFYSVIFSTDVTTSTILYYHQLFRDASNHHVSRKSSESKLEYIPRYSFDTAKAISLKFYLSKYF